MFDFSNPTLLYALGGLGFLSYLYFSVYIRYKNLYSDTGRRVTAWTTGVVFTALLLGAVGWTLEKFTSVPAYNTVSTLSFILGVVALINRGK